MNYEACFSLLLEYVPEGTGNISTGLAKVPVHRLKYYVCVLKKNLPARWNFLAEKI
jgi:hypothetical protein